ncbi:MAG: transcriptional regulator, LuxR family [Ilumatobacteraceae bacterium]|nr:transcriptional regulator, LuxR family [Ilumatobacteraceae bacterium]
MLLERDRELAALDELLRTVAVSGGRVVLIRGEAGIGKSTLVNAFVAAHASDARFAVGFSDDMVAARPLGPFWDFARQEPSLAAGLDSGDRFAMLTACMDLLSRTTLPTVFVIEDTHWADEATLDAIRFLGRRIGRTSGLLLVTYRDGEVDFDHPLRAVIGELPPANLVRMHLDPLSSDAVASMLAGSAIDVDDVMSLTRGNPHFVSEVAASGVDHVPSSVQDSVLSRAARLSPEARALLDLASVNLGRCARTFLESIVGSTADALAECVRLGLLELDGETVSFRHELTRRSVESALSSADRREHNRRVLAALVSGDDMARVIHHALAAGDLDAFVQYAPQAALAAMACESYREADAHFRALEPHLDRLSVVDRADVWDAWARAADYVADSRALGLMDRALALRREAGDDLALARTLTFASLLTFRYGRPDVAERQSLEAIELLERHPPGADLASALSSRASLLLYRSDDSDDTVALAERAMEIATNVGDDRSMFYALIAKGSVEHGRRQARGMAMVEQAHRLAQRNGQRFEEVYALVSMTGLAGDHRQVRLALDLARRSLATATRFELRGMEAHSSALLAEILLWAGEWAEAEDAAMSVLGAFPFTDAISWKVLALLQLRQGRPGAATAFERMWAIADTSDELQSFDPAAATAEDMWLTGRVDPMALERVREAFEQGVRAGPPWPSGSLAFWVWKLGELGAVPHDMDERYRLIIDGDPLAAAELWASAGCPYERAIALSHGNLAAQLEALDVLDALGATAVAAKLRKVIRASGQRAPRGKGRATRAHSAGLTARQAEVLDLIVAGLSNAAIADRLFLSLRTVEHHVSAILARLDVTSREEAVRRTLSAQSARTLLAHSPQK